MSKSTHTMGPKLFSVTAEFKCTKYLTVLQEFRYNFLTATYNALFKNARLSSM